MSKTDRRVVIGAVVGFALVAGICLLARAGGINVYPQAIPLALTGGAFFGSIVAVITE